MVAVKPEILIYTKKTPKQQRPGLAGKVAIIGAFKTEETNPMSFDDLDYAKTTLGDDESFNGCAVLDYIFYGASDIIAVNVSTKSGETWSKDITTANLTAALAKIKHEKFDMLFVADVLSDAFIPIVDAYCNERYLHKLANGYVGAANRNNEAAYITTAGLFNDQCYAILTQALEVNGVELSLLKSAAYYCGVLAGSNVGRSMTQKQIPNVTGVTPEYTFETGDLGLKLLQLGYTTVQCYDRDNDEYIVGNSEQFNGLDLYINRSRDYVVREMALHQFLGEKNDNDVTPTLSEIEQELARVKDDCIRKLQLLKDIEYHIEKADVNCVDVHITKLLFAGVITKINVYITIEVE